MSEMKVVHKNKKIYSAVEQLSAQAYDELDQVIENYPVQIQNVGPLMGRSHVHKFSSASLGKIVVKPYRRGGVWSFFNSDYYIKNSVSRPEVEFQTLLEVAKLGVAVPEPLVAVITRGLLYKGWLVMADIQEQTSLIKLSETDKERLPILMAKICSYVRILIEHKICHVDLHPGNIILDLNDNLYLIDFDKAYRYKAGINALRDYYICRWRRAVIKHRLSQELIEHFCMGLRQNFNKINHEISHSI